VGGVSLHGTLYLPIEACRLLGSDEKPQDIFLVDWPRPGLRYAQVASKRF